MPRQTRCPSSIRRRKLAAPMLALAALMTAADRAPAQGANQTAINRGVSFLREGAGEHMVGECALAALAMLKAGVPPNDPGLEAHLSKVRERFNGSTYEPERRGGSDIYEAGVVIMALAALESTAEQAFIQSVASYLISKQKPNGSWDYDNRTAGDTSISQYAILGLWEAENSGARIPPALWERAARWYISVQSSQGSWNYHRDEPNWPENLAMTAAGVGSLLICKRQLAPYRIRRAADDSPLLTPLEPVDDQASYRVGLSDRELDRAIGRGIAWIGRNFNASGGPWGQTVYYGMYGIERVGALSRSARIGGLDWFPACQRYILSTQQGGGGWNANYGAVVNSAWAILFLTRATEKTIQRIEVDRLGAGTLLGGRGLPDDLSKLTVAQGRVVVRPMNGAVDALLSVLEDPRGEGADAALAGLVDRYYRRGPGALQPFKDRFRKLLQSPDPDLRQIAAWALARTGEIDVAPDLIAALEDPDDGVVNSARLGLQLLGRRYEGEGPPPGATPRQKRQAARAWLDWYRSVQPPDLQEEVIGPIPNPSRTRSSSPSR